MELNTGLMMRNYVEQLFQSFQELERIGIDVHIIQQSIVNFVESFHPHDLDTSINYIQTIIDKRNYPASGLFSLPFLSALKPSADSFGAYPEATIKKLKVLLSQLSGVRCFAAGDKRESASIFKSENQLFPLGLLQFELGEYGKSVVSWDEFLTTKSEYLDDSDASKELLKGMLLAMNRHDTGYWDVQDVHLEEVTPMQEFVLRSPPRS